ncbi:MAG: 2-dehydro-3-deoxy-6-phosphogalactonate aldolase [Glaciecola sp.]
MTHINQQFDTAMSTMPLVAILRGVMPAEVVSIGQALWQCGFTVIEVPLNSPQPYASIALLKEALGANTIVGAGTVLSAQQVREVKQAGGDLCVSPNTNTQVIEQALQLDMISMPGYQSLTEAYTAIEAGARYLKSFPVSVLGVAGVTAHRAVIPSDVSLIGVGGIDPINVQAYAGAGCNGFGLAGSLFQPGDKAIQVADTAAKMVTAVKHSCLPCATQ